MVARSQVQSQFFKIGEIPVRVCRLLYRFGTTVATFLFHSEVIRRLWAEVDEAIGKPRTELTSDQ
eukprot:799912-Prorocentrum_minimum.AAC.1